MYKEEEYTKSNHQLKRRLIVFFAVFLVFSTGTLASFYFRVKWLTIALTIVGGSVLFILYSFYIYPVKAYRKHLWYVLHGRQRDTTGLISSFNQQEETLRDGVSYYPLTINVGNQNNEEDERLFYYDKEKMPLPWPVGTCVTITAPEKLIANIIKV